MPAGRPPKYDPEFHPKRLEEILSSGLSRISFCAEVDICMSTFHKWVEDHQEFSDCYQRSKIKQQAWFEKEGLSNLSAEKYQSKLYAMMARASGQMNVTERKTQIGLSMCNTIEEKLMRIEVALDSGEITKKEAEHLSSFVERIQRITVVQDLEDRLSKLEEQQQEGQ